MRRARKNGMSSQSTDSASLLERLTDAVHASATLIPAYRSEAGWRKGSKRGYPKPDPERALKILNAAMFDFAKLPVNVQGEQWKLESQLDALYSLAFSAIQDAKDEADYNEQMNPKSVRRTPKGGKTTRGCNCRNPKRNPLVETEYGTMVEQAPPALREAVEAWIMGKPLTAAQVKLIKQKGPNPKAKYTDAEFWAGEIIPEMTMAEIQKLKARKNPRPNPIMTIQGHTVSRIPTGYRVDAYGKVFTTKSACRAWLKKHVAHEKSSL